MRGFVRPWLLLLLLQHPSHGYELLERFGQDERMPGIDPGLLYRTLRHLEDEGLVRSSWDAGPRGPARRLYQVTDEGIAYLHAWAEEIQATKERLEHFLQAYRQHFDRGEGNE